MISGNQAGFRKNYSTNDHLVRLKSFIRDAFIKKEHSVAIFFDLEEAYDTTWKYGIMKDLHDIGLRGRLPNFISNFLSDISFNVRIGSTLSGLVQAPQYFSLLAVPRRLFCFGSLVILDVARCYLWLFTLYINIKIGKNSC